MAIGDRAGHVMKQFLNSTCGALCALFVSSALIVSCAQDSINTEQDPVEESQAQTVESQETVKILSDSNVMAEHYLPDFSYAGYNHGVGDVPVLEGTVIDVTEYGVTANDEIDDSTAMIKALGAAHETRGAVIVQLPAGRIIVSDLLKIQRSNIVLRGAGSGPDGTDIHFPRPLKMVDKTDSLNELRAYLKKYDKRQREKDKNIDELFSEYSWSGGFIWVQKEGTRPAAYLESEDGALIKAMYGDAEVKIGSHHWTFTDRPLVRQKTEIKSIEGNIITISDPLLHNISEALPAQFSAWDHITHVGIEDLHISFPDAPSFGHHLEQGYNGIYLTSVFNGWVRDVSVHNGDTGILTYNSANVTIENIETTGHRRAHYSVHAGNVHNVLVKNLTVNNPALHSLSLNTQATKCVFKSAVVNVASVLDQHAGANHQNLFDNVTLRIKAKRDEKGPYYPLWDGSGAGYWQPGHGRYNTSWNLKVNVISGADRSDRCFR